MRNSVEEVESRKESGGLVDARSDEARLEDESVEAELGSA